MIKANLIAFIFTAAVLVSCSNGDAGLLTGTSDSTMQCCKNDNKQGSVASAIPEESIFNITTSWTDQDKRAFHFDDLSGSITVAAMIFTSCQSACPQIMGDIKNIESKLNADMQKDVRFLLITMDPEHDTPERLKAFMNEHQLNYKWSLVCSNDDATMELANVLGVRIKKLSDGGFDHSNAVFVINRNGVIEHKQDGLGQDPAETIKTIMEIL